HRRLREIVIMSNNTNSSNSHNQPRRMMRRFAAVLLGTLAIGPYLGRPVLCRTTADASSALPTKTSETSLMETKKSSPVRRTVQTPSGLIGYTEQGTGPVALFVHGVLLNGYLWRNQLADLSDIRRCIAVDLLAHGDTEIAADQDVSVTAN